jgi:hypothetical protein
LGENRQGRKRIGREPSGTGTGKGENSLSFVNQSAQSTELVTIRHNNDSPHNDLPQLNNDSPQYDYNNNFPILTKPSLKCTLDQLLDISDQLLCISESYTVKKCDMSICRINLLSIDPCCNIVVIVCARYVDFTLALYLLIFTLYLQIYNEFMTSNRHFGPTNTLQK